MSIFKKERARKVRALSWEILSAGCLLLAAQGSRADEIKAAVASESTRAAFFGGKEIEIAFVVRGSEGRGRATWSLAIGPRRLNGVADPDPKKPGRFVVKLPTSDVKPRVPIKMALTFTARAANGDSLGSLEKALWLFPNDPFEDRVKWRESLKVTLFDPPETSGALLKKTGIPFKETVNQAELAEKTDGMVMIGAGVSFGDYPGLWEAILKLSARGIPVLCLAPSAGELPLPDGGAESIALHRASVIRRLDKRLDAADWPPNGKVAVGGVSLKGEEKRAVVEAGKAGNWPWLEINYAVPRGKLVVCGFDFLDDAKWSAGPTPRFLFARILEYLTEEKNDEPIKERNDEQ